MTPRPPSAKSASAVPSSPERTVKPSGTGQNGHAPVGGFYDRRRHGLAFGPGERRGLSGRSAGNEKVDSFLDLPVDEPLQGSEVDPAFLVEGGDQCGSASAPLGPFR